MSQYVCSSCGFGSASWYGKCPSCGGWNTFAKLNEPKKGRGRSKVSQTAQFTQLSEVDSLSTQRMETHIYEFDRVLGGGFVKGEAILMAGEPGVGKSTLLLKLLSGFKVMYVSGEESGHQVKQRADRIKADVSNFSFSNEINIDSIIKALEDKRGSFDVIVIDSIQTVYAESSDSPVGSMAQIKESASRIIESVKSENSILILIGHVTKGGDIAGPKTLEHLVDCVLYLEGEQQSHYRLLRSHKNRFGPTDEVGVFEMSDSGLKEIDKPTALLDSSSPDSPGRSIVASVEGSRVLFYEIQSLVVPTSLAMPRRVVSGIDYNRLQLLLAVIRKHLGIALDSFDIYVNVVGGLSAKLPAADLGIVVSVISSVKNIVIPHDHAYIGEIGLLGEIRSVYGQAKIIKDAKRFGMKKIYSSIDCSTIKNIMSLLTKAKAT